MVTRYNIVFSMQNTNPKNGIIIILYYINSINLIINSKTNIAWSVICLMHVCIIDSFVQLLLHAASTYNSIYNIHHLPDSNGQVYIIV